MFVNYIAIFLLICITLSYGYELKGWSTPSNILVDRMNNMRGFRYCEILSSRNQESIFKLFTLRAYNTLVSGCDMDKWNKITNKTVRDVDGGIIVKLNGPRYWAFDTVSQNSTLVNPTVTVIGDIEMVTVGIVQVHPTELFKLAIGSTLFYEEREVNRRTIYIFKKNKPVFYLKNNNTGSTYIMQSFTTMINKDLDNLDAFLDLKQKLTLPPGWTFNVKYMDHDLYVRAKNDIGVIVNDNFFNVYSQFDEHLLYEPLVPYNIDEQQVEVMPKQADTNEPEVEAKQVNPEL